MVSVERLFCVNVDKNSQWQNGHITVQLQGCYFRQEGSYRVSRVETSPTLSWAMFYAWRSQADTKLSIAATHRDIWEGRRGRGRRSMAAGGERCRQRTQVIPGRMNESYWGQRAIHHIPHASHTIYTVCIHTTHLTIPTCYGVIFYTLHTLHTTHTHTLYRTSTEWGNIFGSHIFGCDIQYQNIKWNFIV